MSYIHIFKCFHRCRIRFVTHEHSEADLNSMRGVNVIFEEIRKEGLGGNIERQTLKGKKMYFKPGIVNK